MKKSIIFAALSLVFVTDAMAGEINAVNSNSTVASQAAKRKDELIVAVTNPGKVAADTAWLLSNQVRANPQDTPVLLVLKPATRIEMLNSLKLSATDLPALIYLDSNGNILGKVINAAPSFKVYQNMGTGADSLS